MLCNACEKFRFPNVDGKDGKDRNASGHSGSLRRTDSRTQRIGSDSAALSMSARNDVTS